MTATGTVHLVRADQVRVGDFLTTSGGYYSGRVTALPEWEDIDTWGDGSHIDRCGTITCEGFGMFVSDDDEITVLR